MLAMPHALPAQVLFHYFIWTRRLALRRASDLRARRSIVEWKLALVDAFDHPKHGL